MKKVGLLSLVFCIGLLAASFAFAGNGSKDPRPGHTESSSTTTTTSKKACQNVSLKGTAPATSFTVTVDRANRAGRDLKTATVTFSGKVSINGRLCSDGSGATLKLRNLKVAKAASSDD